MTIMAIAQIFHKKIKMISKTHKNYLWGSVKLSTMYFYWYHQIKKLPLGPTPKSWFWTFYFFAPLRDDILVSHCYFFICLITVDYKKSKTHHNHLENFIFWVFSKMSIWPFCNFGTRVQEKTNFWGYKRKVIL